ncbi:MAG: transporter substrate-binding domain-containing protein [Bdellovibrio sp.]|nr:transporter substrate-binding domain-containing protein [Bdellovibrio sp.]
MIKLWVIAIIAANFAAGPVFAKTAGSPLRVAIPYSLPPPLLIMNKDKPEGIVKDYVNVISKHLHRDFTYVVIPKFRIHEMIAKGLAELNCYTSPLWVPNPEKYTWSKVLFHKKEIIATLKKTPTSLADLKGQRVGTVLRYIYPHLDPLFENKRLIREDVATEEQNMQKLINKRIDYVVADEVQLDYFLKENADKKFVVNRMLINEYPIHCLLTTHDASFVKAFNHAIDDIKKSDEFQGIFNKYK